MIGFPFIELPVTESTNNYAMGLIHAELAQPGMAIMAYEQTAGKGQRGKTWIAGPGENINLSVIIQPSPAFQTQPFYLSAVTALAVHQFISQYTTPDELFIKWPNDIYWRDRKAAGILIENVMGSAGKNIPATYKWSVIGIGININTEKFPENLKQAVSLRQITGKPFDIRELVLRLYRELMLQLNAFTKQPAHIMEAYNALLYKKGEECRFRKGNRLFSAVVKRVTANGELVIEHGIEESVQVGEVSFEPSARP